MPEQHPLIHCRLHHLLSTGTSQRGLSAGCRASKYPTAAFLLPLQYPHNDGGVYRCGFAGSQQAYEAAYDRLFTALDWLSGRLANQRYLVGETITEADVRLFTTLARFDPVYHGHFKCNRSKLSEMPVLWAYARDLFQTTGFGDTVDFVQIKQHYYIVHADINPTRIVPKGPELANWLTPHGREALGGRPFGDGVPPGPVSDSERVPLGHGPS
jgi:putative glutathione S-transferase